MGTDLETQSSVKDGAPFQEGSRRRDVRDYVKQTSVVVYFLTFLFLYATIKVEMPAELYYLLFAMILISIGLWVESDSQGKVKVFPRAQLRLTEVPPQVLGGFLFAAVFVIATVSLGTLTLKSDISIGAFIGELIPNIMLVGGVETLMLIVYLRVVYMGEFVYPFIFAFSHTRIASLWMQGQFPIESFTFFVYAVAQAVIFLLIYAGRTLLPEKIAPICGAIAVAVYHGGINTVTQYSEFATGG